MATVALPTSPPALSNDFSAALRTAWATASHLAAVALAIVGLALVALIPFVVTAIASS
jgi:hypothetical protein